MLCLPEFVRPHVDYTGDQGLHQTKLTVNANRLKIIHFLPSFDMLAYSSLPLYVTNSISRSPSIKAGIAQQPPLVPSVAQQPPLVPSVAQKPPLVPSVAL